MALFPRSSYLTLGALTLCSVSYAQTAISARSGMVHFSEGEVTVAGLPVDTKFGHFTDVKEGQILKTMEGRAEILLTPGVFLRVAENSSLKMISSRLIDTRVELLTGSILLECAELQKDNAITFVYKDATVEFHKKGLVRIDADKDLIRAYDGEATVLLNGQTLTLKEGKETQLVGVLSPEKFDNKLGDSFYRWASRRASSLAVANISGAKMMKESGYNYSYGSWMYNPMFGAFTYIPYRGYYASPFGSDFYSPSYVTRIYEVTRPAPVTGGGGVGNLGQGTSYNADYGYNTASSRGSAGYQSSGNMSAPATSAASAPAGGGGGRGGDGGGAHNSGGGSSGGRGR